MKWIQSIAYLGFIFAICSCDSTGTIVEVEDDAIKTIEIALAPMENEDILSRVVVDETANAKWGEKDTIGIFPTVGGQVEFPITGSANQTSATFDGGGWALRANYAYHAYYPFNHSNRDVENIPVSYLNQEQDGMTSSREHLSRRFVLAAPPAQSENGYVSFTLKHTANMLNVSLTLPKAATYTAMTIYTDAAIFPVKKTFNLKTTQISDAFSIEEKVIEYSDHLTLKLKNVTTTSENQIVDVSMIFPSVSEGTHALNVAVYDKNGYAYTGKLLRKDNGNQAYATFSKNKYQNRQAAPQLQEGFNIGLEDWIKGEEIEGIL